MQYMKKRQFIHFLQHKLFKSSNKDNIYFKLHILVYKYDKSKKEAIKDKIYNKIKDLINKEKLINPSFDVRFHSKDFRIATIRLL